MKNLAVIAVATMLSASAFGQGRPVETRPERNVEVVTEAMRGNITKARSELRNSNDAVRFDSMRAAVGDFAMASLASELVRTLNHPKLTASDSQNIDAIITGAKTATAEISNSMTQSQRSRVRTSINNAILSQMRLLTETNGEFNDMQKFSDVAVEIARLAKAGNATGAVAMANEVTRLNGNVLARTGRNGGDLYKGLRDEAASKAMNQIATEYGLTALNPGAFIENGEVMMRDPDGRKRPFDPSKDVMGEKKFRDEVYARFMEAWRKVLECMGGVKRATA